MYNPMSVSKFWYYNRYYAMYYSRIRKYGTDIDENVNK